MSDAQRPLVIQTEHLDPAARAWLSERCEVVTCQSEDPGFAALLGRADALVIRTYTQVSDALLARAPRLRVVGRAGVGLDNVDLRACAARNVAVCNTPSANTRAVVEYVLALLLDATRPRQYLDQALDARAWKQRREHLQAGRQLCELTLGIWGLGKIGSQLARAMGALNVRVIYHDLRDIPHDERFGAVPVSRAELCARAHAISMHVDGRRSNTGLVGPGDFERLRDDVILVNTSRGFVIDDRALAAFLRANPRATALLDVHEPEPFGPDHPLLGLPNARLSPHIASATRLANANMSRVVEDVWRVLSGQAPEHPGVPDPA